MDYYALLSSFWPYLVALYALYEFFTVTLRPQFELVSNIALWCGKLITIQHQVDDYGSDRNLNVKIENKPFLGIFRRPLNCQAQMKLVPSTGRPHGPFDIAPLGKAKGEDVELRVGIERTLQLLTSTRIPSETIPYATIPRLPPKPDQWTCTIPPNGSPLPYGDFEVVLTLSWGIGSKTYRIGKFHLPDIREV